MKKKNVKFMVGGAIVAIALGHLMHAQIHKTALCYLTVGELKKRGLPKHPEKWLGLVAQYWMDLFSITLERKIFVSPSLMEKVNYL